jgi:hypothetical protein
MRRAEASFRGGRVLKQALKRRLDLLPRLIHVSIVCHFSRSETDFLFYSLPFSHLKLICPFRVRLVHDQTALHLDRLRLGPSPRLVRPNRRRTTSRAAAVDPLHSEPPARPAAPVLQSGRRRRARVAARSLLCPKPPELAPPQLRSATAAPRLELPRALLQLVQLNSQNPTSPPNSRAAATSATGYEKPDSDRRWWGFYPDLYRCLLIYP